MSKQSFHDAMVAAGLPAHPIPSDGQIHRFGKKKECWAINFGSGGAFGDWSKGLTEKWSDSHSPIDTQYMNEHIEKARQIREQEIHTQQLAAQQEVQQQWQELSSTGTSTYLTTKKIYPYGIRFLEHTLVMPLRDSEGRLWSVQYINEDGQKRFKKHAKTHGCFHVIGEIEDGKPLYICEGYATGASIYMATQQTVIIACNAGNLEPVIASLKHRYNNSTITICADNDQWKDQNIGKIKAEEAAQKHGCNVVLPAFSDTIKDKHKPTDFNDLHVLEGLEEVTKQVMTKHCYLNAVSINQFLSIDIAPRTMLLAPIIPSQGLVMLYAMRGIGKTHIALEIAYSAAAGDACLGNKWQATKPHKVLLVDGEMPARSLQERLASIVNGHEKEPPSGEYLSIITPDLQEHGIPNLSTPEGQHYINEHLDGIELVILDNLSTLCRSGRENEAESWLPVQEWALSLRKKGISVLFVHHASKNGSQRGTSRREDVLDTVISLKRPHDYESDQGARFEVHYEKGRDLHGEDAAPFEAILQKDDDKAIWIVKSIDDQRLSKIVALYGDGLSTREISQETEIPKSTVNRLINKAKMEGLIDG